MSDKQPIQPGRPDFDPGQRAVAGVLGLGQTIRAAGNQLIVLSEELRGEIERLEGEATVRNADFDRRIDAAQVALSQAELERDQLQAQRQVLADYLCMASPGIQADCMAALAALTEAAVVADKPPLCSSPEVVKGFLRNSEAAAEAGKGECPGE